MIFTIVLSSLLSMLEWGSVHSSFIQVRIAIELAITLIPSNTRVNSINLFPSVMSRIMVYFCSVVVMDCLMTEMRTTQGDLGRMSVIVLALVNDIVLLRLCYCKVKPVMLNIFVVVSVILMSVHILAGHMVVSRILIMVRNVV